MSAWFFFKCRLICIMEYNHFYWHFIGLYQFIRLIENNSDEHAKSTLKKFKSHNECVPNCIVYFSSKAKNLWFREVFLTMFIVQTYILSVNRRLEKCLSLQYSYVLHLIKLQHKLHCIDMLFVEQKEQKDADVKIINLYSK